MISLTPDLSLLVIMAIFLANYFIVRKFLIQPINEILVSRETRVHDADSRYEEALARFNAATTEMETRVQGAKRDASQIRERHRSEAGSHRSEMVQKTRAEADAILRSAEEQLSRDISQARETIDRDAETLARLAAERILGRKLV